MPEPAATAPSGPDRPRILLFYDYACPFCYVDQFRFERLAREHDAEIVPVPFELRPTMPEEGLSASKDGLGHPPRVEAHILRVARDEGVPMQLPDHIPKTHLAIVMAEVARDSGTDVHWRTHQALFRAYYGEGRDIGCKDVLLEIAEGIEGLSAEKVVAAWLEDTLEERLHSFRHLAMHMGIDATPAALVCNELLIGTRPYEVLERAIADCLVTPASAEKAAEEDAGEE